MWPHFEPDKSTASVEKLIVSGNDAVMFGTFSHTAAGTGRSFTTPVAMHLEVKGDKIVRLLPVRRHFGSKQGVLQVAHCPPAGINWQMSFF
jgi:hypothetical protein